MNSPTSLKIKAKKKYSGALFLENDEFDCFADEVRDGVPNESPIRGQNSMKALMKKDSSHNVPGSASKKFAKQIDEENHEESESDVKPGQQKQVRAFQSQYPPQLDIPNQHFNSFPPTNDPGDAYKNIFPSNARNLGLNSIPTYPGMQHQLHSHNQYDQKAYHGQYSSYSQPQFFNYYQNYPYQPYNQASYNDESYAGMNSANENQHILENFDDYISQCGDCKVVISKLEKDSNFFDQLFGKLANNIVHYSQDSLVYSVIIKIIELSSNQYNKLKKIVTALQGKVVELASDPYATRILQKLVEKLVSKDDLLDKILSEIEGNVCMLVMCNNGNHVIQKLICACDPQKIDFVYQEILEKFKSIGAHKHGCCVIQRCFDYSNDIQKVP